MANCWFFVCQNGSEQLIDARSENATRSINVNDSNKKRNLHLVGVVLGCKKQQRNNIYLLAHTELSVKFCIF